MVEEPVCAQCGKALADGEIGDVWQSSWRSPSRAWLCSFCACFVRLNEPDGEVVTREPWHLEKFPGLPLEVRDAVR